MIYLFRWIIRHHILSTFLRKIDFICLDNCFPYCKLLLIMFSSLLMAIEIGGVFEDFVGITYLPSLCTMARSDVLSQIIWSLVSCNNVYSHTPNSWSVSCWFSATAECVRWQVFVSGEMGSCWLICLGKTHETTLKELFEDNPFF